MSDQNQLERLIAEERRELLGFIARRVRTREDAEDLVQDVLVRAHRNAGELKDDSAVRAWLYRIARNRVIDYYRANSRNRVQTREDLVVAAPSDDDPLSESDVAHCLKSILAFMPEKYSEAVRLSDVDEYTAREIADKIGLSEPGAKSRIQRGRAMLQEMLEECLEMEFDAFGQLAESSHKCHDCRFCQVNTLGS